MISWIWLIVAIGFTFYATVIWVFLFALPREDRQKCDRCTKRLIDSGILTQLVQMVIRETEARITGRVGGMSM